MKEFGGRILAFLVMLVAVIWPLGAVYQRAAHGEGLPQWDMAKYGAAGLELAEALAEGRVFDFLAGVNALSSWPPAFPLLEMPAFWLFGPSFAVPRVLVWCLFVLLLVAALWTATGFDQRDGFALGLALAGLLAGSPFFQVLGSLVLLEVPGTLLTLFALGAGFRTMGRQDAASWRLVAWTSLALFFCKYNYGVLWLVPAAVAEGRRRAGSWRELGRRAVAWVHGLALPRPLVVFFVLVALLLLRIRLGGGIDTTLVGVRLKATSIGSPLYVLYLLALLVWLRRPRKALADLRSWLASLPERDAVLMRWLAFPIAFWMLIPPHLKDFFGFLENRSSELNTLGAESLLFYPHSLVVDYGPSSALGILLLIAGLIGCGYIFGGDDRARLLAAVVACGFASLLVHPYKLPRFAATLVPVLWLLGLWVLIRILRGGFEKALPQRVVGVLVLVVATSLGAWAGSRVHVERLEIEASLRTVPAEVLPLIDRVVELSEGEEETLLLGTWNLLSPPLVRWRARQLEAEAPRMVWPSSKERRRASRRLDGMPTVLWLEPGPSMTTDLAAAMTTEGAWLVPLGERLDSGATHALAAVEEPVPGYRLRIYRHPERSGE